jgi:hypothetical protein
LDDLDWMETHIGWLLYFGDRPHVCGKFRRQRAVWLFARGLYDLKTKLKRAA